MFLKADSSLEKSRIAVIAGRGEYPILCAKNIAAAGHGVAVIAVDDGVDENWLASLPPETVARVSVGQIAKLIKFLKKFSAQFAIMAGQVTPKKLFHGMVPDFKAIKILTMLSEHNAASIFGAVAGEIEKSGVKLLDSRSFMENDLATLGPMSCKKSTANQKSLQFGIGIAREIARLNIGQSVVVRKGTVVAVEDFAGTDDLISRVAKFNLSDAIFIKTAKHGLDFRFDVPIFGMQTLENLRASKIKYAALEAENVIILNRERVLSAAKDFSVEIIGF
jgi:DUF1009 family protein